MDTTRLYLATTDVDFAHWLVGRCQAASPAELTSRPGALPALQAWQRPVLGQYLGIDIGEAQREGGQAASQLTGQLQFTILPVGRGGHIEVHAACGEPALRPYLNRLIVEMTRLWARDQDDLDPDQCHVLRQMRLSADLPGFAAGLREWLAVYRDDDVQAASLFWAGCQDGQTPAPSALGTASPTGLIRLRLHAWHRPWAGIHELKLEVAVAEAHDHRSLVVVISQPGFRYREAQPFVDALTRYCQRSWRAIPWNQAALAGGAPSSPTDGRPAAADLFGRLPWEQIPDHLWDRPALRAWWEGRSCPEIGREIHQSAKTVLNRLCILRKTYGPAIVPTDQQRLEKGIRLRLSGW